MSKLRMAKAKWAKTSVANKIPKKRENDAKPEN
jgi:hypothetical protein